MKNLIGGQQLDAEKFNWWKAFGGGKKLGERFDWMKTVGDERFKWTAASLRSVPALEPPMGSDAAAPWPNGGPQLEEERFNWTRGLCHTPPWRRRCWENS